jgi:tRNA(Ile)-lysidine synthase
MRFTRTIEQYIERNALLTKEGTVLVTLSGGSDSVALLCVLHRLGYQCRAVHCNFELRGEESERDEAFVKELCQKRKINLDIVHFDTRQYAETHHLSIEMAARELRYAYFEELRKKHNAQAIAVAHHRDDNAETMLLNLIRGTGLQGLCGMRPKNGFVVRPLLCVTRHDILDYLHHIDQSYVTDSSNLDDAFGRNKIRLHLLPLMREMNPSVVDDMQLTASYLSEVAKIYNKGIEEGRTRVADENGNINIEALKAEPSPLALLFEILHPLSFNSTQVREIADTLDGQSGKVFTSGDYQVVKDRNKLLLVHSTSHADDSETTPPFTLSFSEYDNHPNFDIPRGNNKVCFDKAKLEGELSLRKWKEGDRFVPFGMKGSKLVSDFLTDSKLSLVEKKAQWLLCCGENIVWVIGRRTDNRFKVSSTTKRILVAEIIEKK